MARKRKQQVEDIQDRTSPVDPGDGTPLMKPYYEYGGITIYHGDCREILPSVAGDLILTDPPYGVNFRYTTAYIDSPENWATLIDESLPMMRRAPLVLLTSGTRQLWRYPPADWLLCWAHPGSTRASGLGGFSEWEPILVYGKRRIYNDFKYLPDCVNHSPEAAGHPCPKPLRLFSWLVSVGSDVDDLVVDPFVGSGTTLVAAKNLGRRAVGIEIEEKYCEIAAKRLSQEVFSFDLAASSS